MIKTAYSPEWNTVMIDFNIMSLFSYSKHVRFMTLESRAEAEARLRTQSRKP